jgi:hypothetical protein
MGSVQARPRRRKAVRVAGVVTGMTTGTALAVAATTPVTAGTNGQHVVVFKSLINANYVQVCGKNQASHWTCTSVQHDPTTPGSFPRYWFKSFVNVWGWTTYAPGRPANYGHKSDCYVDSVNNSSNWSICNINPL